MEQLSGLQILEHERQKHSTMDLTGRSLKLCLWYSTEICLRMSRWRSISIAQCAWSHSTPQIPSGCCPFAPTRSTRIASMNGSSHTSLARSVAYAWHIQLIMQLLKQLDNSPHMMIEFVHRKTLTSWRWL